MTNMTTDKPASTLTAKPKGKAAVVKKQAVAAKRPEPSPAPAAQDDDAAVFQQGRTAAMGSISADDAPYDKNDRNHAVWSRGHKSVTG